MSAPTADELADIRAVARINNFLPDIRALVDKRVEIITSRVMQEVNAGTLTPDKAYAAWYEVSAYRKMLKSFDVKTKVAPSTANKEI